MFWTQLRCTPRLICFWLRSANQRSTRLSHDALVGCEVDMKTCVARESPPHARRFVRAVVIEDQMHLEVRRDADVNRLQELQKLLTPMPSMTLAKDLERPLAELDLFAPRRWQLG